MNPSSLIRISASNRQYYKYRVIFLKKFFENPWTFQIKDARGRIAQRFCYNNLFYSFLSFCFANSTFTIINHLSISFYLTPFFFRFSEPFFCVSTVSVFFCVLHQLHCLQSPPLTPSPTGFPFVSYLSFLHYNSRVHLHFLKL